MSAHREESGPATGPGGKAWTAIDNQDDAGPLGVFRDETVFLGHVPDEDVTGEVARQAVADAHGLPLGRLAVLGTCRRHPQVAAVDCLICVPEEG